MSGIGGTLPTHGLLFVALLVGTIVVVGGLTFFPALVRRTRRRTLHLARRRDIVAVSHCKPYLCVETVGGIAP